MNNMNYITNTLIELVNTNEEVSFKDDMLNINTDKTKTIRIHLLCPPTLLDLTCYPFIENIDTEEKIYKTDFINRGYDYDLNITTHTLDIDTFKLKDNTKYRVGIQFRDMADDNKSNSIKYTQKLIVNSNDSDDSDDSTLSTDCILKNECLQTLLKTLSRYNNWRDSGISWYLLDDKYLKKLDNKSSPLKLPSEIMSEAVSYLSLLSTQIVQRSIVNIGIVDDEYREDQDYKLCAELLSKLVYTITE
jgi:hypothetical protein